jgi:hypothetical protein
MKELFRSSDTALIGFYESILDDAEIPHFVRNGTTQQTIVGGLMTAILPLPEFWPALCVVNDHDHPEAMRLLREVREAGPTSKDDWICVPCGETAPGNFTACWNCGAAHSTDAG